MLDSYFKFHQDLNVRSNFATIEIKFFEYLFQVMF